MMDATTIKALEAKGFSRWQKNGHDRLYINSSHFGLECSYYNTGNISSASLNGEPISNSEAYRIKSVKAYVDVKTGKLHIAGGRCNSVDEIRETLQALIDEAVAEAEAEKAKETTETIEFDLGFTTVTVTASGEQAEQLREFAEAHQDGTDMASLTALLEALQA